MPLFGNKFNPKKTPPRKSGSLSNLSLDATRRQQEFGLDYGKITMKVRTRQDNGTGQQEKTTGQDNRLRRQDNRSEF